MAVLKYWDETLSQWLPVAPGPKGDKGDKGDTGDLANLDIGTVTTGSPAAAHIDGNFEDGYELDLTLPSVGAGSIHNADVNAAADIDRSKIAGTALTTSSTSVFSVLDYGAVGDGTHDDTTAVQDALDAASAAKGIVLIPPGTYKATATLRVGDDTTITGTGTISSTTPGFTGTALTVSGKHDVLIEGITIAGNMDAYDPDAPGNQYAEWKHGVDLRGNCERVTVRNVTTTDNRGDGVCIGPAASGDGTYCRDIVIENVTSEYNFRCGLAITSASGVRVVGGSYSHQEETLGTGIDIEPDLDTDVIDNIEITGVSADYNTQVGILTYIEALPAMRGIRVVGGRATYNGTYGVVVGKGAHSITVEGVLVANNTLSGLRVWCQVAQGLHIRNNTIVRNGLHGVHGDPWVDPGTGKVRYDWINDVTVTDNIVLDNNTADDADGDGIRIDNGPVTTARNRVGNTGTGHQRYGLHTGFLIEQETHIHNDLVGNETAPALYGAPAVRRTIVDGSSVLRDVTVDGRVGVVLGSASHLYDGERLYNDGLRYDDDVTVVAPRMMSGFGTPEGAVAAQVGSTFSRFDGGTGTAFYIKETGTTTSSGWVAK
jgi:hypothetical protein